MWRIEATTCFQGGDINFSKVKKRLGCNQNPMSRQDNERIKIFMSQHEKGSSDQNSVADKRNGVTT